MVKKRQAEKLHHMIQDGDVSGVKALLRSEGSNGRDVCSVELGSSGSALHCAAASGSVEIVRVILAAGVRVNTRTSQGDIGNGVTALHQATLFGHLPVLEFLIREGADVNITDAEGQTALHAACRQDDVDVVEIFVQNGAKVNAGDNRGQTPLQTSILRNSGTVSRYLIEHGADVHTIDKDGQSPLHYASEWEDLETVLLLLANGARVNMQDDDGNTAMHVTNDADVIDVLVEHGGDLTLRNKIGKPAEEKRLDMEKKEYKDIDAALSRHAEKMKQRKASGRDLHHPPPHRIFSPGPPIPEAELKTARSNMLLELQKKTGFKGSSGRGGHSDKPPPSTPRATALVPSPLTRDCALAVDDMNSQMEAASI